MLRLSVLVLLAVTTALFAADTEVRTIYGPITGVEKDGVRAYLGIPYAAPPVGALRWKAPEKPAPWSAARACTEFGPACPQNVGGYGKIEPQDEAGCLTMNVWTAAKDGDDKRPVLVWIHGGGGCIGASFQKAYEGTPLAKNGLVVVTFNYRLGPLGFFAHKDLSAESQKRTSGNYGLQDMIHALHWVKANIKEFGGDPKNVTIMGESFGGAAVGAMMITPLAKGLFNKVVVMSGSQYVQLRYLNKRQDKLDSMEDFGWEFVKRLGVPHDGKMLETLREMPIEDLLKGEKFTSVIPGALTADHICVDGLVLKEQMHESFAEGRIANVPYLAGTVRDEGTFFAAKLKIADVANYQAFFSQQFGDKASEAMKLYPAATDADVKKALDDFCSDIFFRFTREATRNMAKIQKDSFLYHFNHGPEKQKVHPLGIHHGYEIKYFFGNLEGPDFNDVDRTVANQTMGYLARFCATGNPNPAGDGDKNVVAWPRYQMPDEKKSDDKGPRSDEAFLLFDNPFQPRRAFNHKRLDALEKLR